MPNLSANEVITQKHKRNFIQFGGGGPANVVKYAGQDAQYMKIEGVKNPESGGVDPIFVPDHRFAGKYRLVGRKISPPDLASASIVMYERHGAIPKQLQRIGCPFNAYEPTGDCKDLSDFVSGWSDYVLIYSGAIVTDKDLGDRTAFDSDDMIEDTLSITLSSIYPIGAMSFGDNATTVITLEVIDVVYGNREQCASCGPEDDGTKLIYAITKSSGSTPGTAPKLVYSTDGGSTWTQSAVTGLGDIEDPQGIDVVGKYLVVYTRTAGGPTTSGYYYSEINSTTGVPGTWTKVTSGFVAGQQIYDMYVLSPREIFFSAGGGYIYKSTDITAGVSVNNSGNTTSNALRRISGKDETIVAVGDGGTVIYTTNRGVTWVTTTASPIIDVLTALAVLSGSLWWVGTVGGKIYYTRDSGASWTEKTFSGSGSGIVYDIVFATAEVGYFSHSTATPTARVFATWDGGNSFTNSAPRILNMPTYNRANRLAFPVVDDSIAANNLAVAGLAGNGSDGILLLGVAGRL